ncbi:hypothetical protein BV25DRAFT_1885748 [Artomyces pyxidatus]|uniref:Uncharacterized protein n=1 Tax=Artomyces pyxidatus TaxID=48021 RepID=A0ACB8T1M1_9AGAM|nr:hypothetical protein BV25DRAFT_1885748 [Artomyces pyxidatus]
MSIDLDWNKLDASLANSLVDLLNTQLQNAPRPSFIGPIEVSSFDFGSQGPDIEIVDLRNIYRDFLDDDDEDADGERDPEKAADVGVDDDDGFEWVSRKHVGRAMAEEAPAYHHLPPHVRYGRGPASDMFMSTPSLGHSFGPAFDSEPPPAPPQPDPDAPNLQLHLHVTWHSNLRLTLTTSLRINYPSPMFMSLPIKLSVTGLLFTGELAIAYEGSRKRVHLCVLDDLDPYGPAGDRPKRDSVSSTPPSDPDAEVDGLGLAAGVGGQQRQTKPLPVGQRLLPNILIESELGQADKHVLKNVTRVEKFIQDVIRKTVEEELVFPNFHTLVLG